MDEIKRLQSVYESLVDFLRVTGVELLNIGTHKYNFKLKATSLKSMKVACIMDDFSFLSYEPECELMQLTSHNWENEIEMFKPDMLFVESAWHGKDSTWYKKIYLDVDVEKLPPELPDLINYCKAGKIPVVFWGKEDPVYTRGFMSAASLADVVFTSDLGSISNYKATTGNEHCYHLHFAAQPIFHNPIETEERKDKFCFAGAYYHKYVDRSKVFDDFANYFKNSKGLDIYDRNFNNARPEHKFPSIYSPLILGNLPPDQMDKAYKGYYFGINMNSIQQSPTMFARRVFELMASNTIVVGNYGSGVRNYFGDLTISTDNLSEMQRCMTKYVDTDTKLRQLRLKALRKILQDHLYEDRLSYIVEKIFDEKLKSALPTIAVISSASDPQKIDRIRELFNRQSYENKRLYLLYEDASLDVTKLKEDFVAYFSEEDTYGEEYLTDLALATRFLKDPVDGIGKASFYRTGELQNAGSIYRYTNTLTSRRSIIRVNSDLTLSELLDGSLLHGNFFSTDEFNYNEGGELNDANLIEYFPKLNEGIPIQEIYHIAESVPMPYLNSDIILTPQNIVRLFTQSVVRRGLQGNLVGEKLRITAKLADEKVEYLHFGTEYRLSDISSSKKFSIFFDADITDKVGAVIIFYDEHGKNLGNKFIDTGKNVKFSVSDKHISDATTFKISLRFKGSSELIFRSICIGSNTSSDINLYPLVQGDTIVVSNLYPSYDNLYRNMFVHARMKAYQKEGLHYQMLCTNVYAKTEYREFDGVNLISGNAHVLADAMETGKVKTVCVHFLDEHMYTAFKGHLDNIRLIIWVHGSEVQPWWRREFNYGSQIEKEQAMSSSDQRMTLWREVFELSKTKNIHFVFVSQYFADEVMEDYKVALSHDKYSIIHNAIDTDTFDYVEKNPDQRKKIFMCRPWASRKYANDLSVLAIKDLSKSKIFSDLHFHIAGTGILFDELTAPLRKFKNVTLEERYYTHDELSTLYKEYGVCLAPTRWDSHGVSRDEAMSSGLVPITNAITAIPEFVNEDCGILVPSEDWKGLADGILELYHDPEKFAQLSKNAAERVRRQSSAQLVVEKEINLIEGSRKLTLNHHKITTASAMEKRLKLVLYADIDLNLLDGSAVWLVSLLDVLSLDPSFDVHVILKTPIKNSSLVDSMMNSHNVTWINPYQHFKSFSLRGGRLSQEKALELLQAYEKEIEADFMIIRQIELSLLNALPSQFLAKCFLYVILRESYYSSENQHILKELFKKTTGFFTQTDLMRERLADLLKCPSSSIHMMTPMIPDKNLPRDHIFENKSNRLVYTGKFAAVWYVQEILYGIKQLHENGENVTFDIAGDKFQACVNKESLLQQFEQMPNVTWHGRLTRLKSMELIESCDVGVTWRDPNANESFEALDISTKLLEYAMLGKPILLNPTPVHKALLGDDYPLFVDTPESFYDKVKLVLSDSDVYEEAARRCHRASEFFGYNKSLSRLRKVFYSKF